MAQFDVYRTPPDVADEAFPYVLDIQSALLEHLNVRVVVPLARADVVDPPLRGLNPRFQVEDRTVVMATTLIGGLPTRTLSDPVTNLGERRYEIVGAIDVLVTGI